MFEINMSSSLIFATVAYLMCFFLMLFVNYKYKDKFKGVNNFTLAFFLLGIGTIGAIFRENLSLFLSIIVANLIVILGRFFLLRGVLIFYNTKSNDILLFGSIVLFISGFLYFTYITNNTTARIIIFCVFSAGIHLVAVFKIYQFNKQRKYKHDFLLIANLCFVIYYIVRLSTVILTKESYLSFLDYKYDALLIFLEGIFALVFFMGILFTFNDRLNREIHRHTEELGISIQISEYEIIDIEEFLDYILKQSLIITQSKIGYLHHYSEETKKFTLKTCSKDVMSASSVDNHEIQYQLENSGQLREVVCQRKAIVTNDYGMKYPKDIPKGHVQIMNYLSVPVFVDDHIDSVVSVANEMDDYTEEDFSQLSNIMSLVYKKIDLFNGRKKLFLAKNEAEKATKAKSNFLASMSHELRTPLNSVISLSSILKQKLSNIIPTEEYSYIDIIERNGKHLLSLINDILDLSRIESGKEEISLSKFTIDELVKTVIVAVEYQAQEKNIKLSTKLGKELPALISDFSKCQHVLGNIVANAVKFTEKGKVDISAIQADDMIHIIVKDTGIGIEQDKIQYIFDEFRQIDESLNKMYQGTGLGLYIAQKNIRLLNGSIEVKSSFEKGSTFTIKLPLKSSQQPADISTEELERYSVPDKLTVQNFAHSHQESSILLVEDNDSAIVQITDIFEKKDYILYVARDGKEALEQIDKIIPDVILLDLMMPEIDGFEVLRKIRSNQKTKNIPVIILTAKHINKKELEFLKGNNIFQLVQKGNVNKKNLLKIIENALLAQVKKKNSLIPEGPAKSKAVDKARVLIVEDNPDNMITIRALLKESFYIIEAIDGKVGVKKAKLYKPDLILLDISLPVMDGFKVFDSIRKDKTLSHIPIIAVTAGVMEGSREEILAYGFNGYIPKPIDEKLLKTTIQEVLIEK